MFDKFEEQQQKKEEELELILKWAEKTKELYKLYKASIEQRNLRDRCFLFCFIDKKRRKTAIRAPPS